MFNTFDLRQEDAPRSPRGALPDGKEGMSVAASALSEDHPIDQILSLSELAYFAQPNGSGAQPRAARAPPRVTP